MALMRAKNFLKHVGSGHVVAAAKITMAGSGTSATILEGSEFISTVTHTSGQADIIFTFKDTVAKVVWANGELVGGTNAGDYININAIANEGTATALTVTFKTYQNGGSERADSGGTAYFLFYLRESNVGTPGGN